MMTFKMEGEPTTLPGAVITFLLTGALWVGAFGGGWSIGLHFTGSEFGGTAGALFPALAAGKLWFRVWTK